MGCVVTPLYPTFEGTSSHLISFVLYLGEMEFMLLRLRFGYALSLGFLLMGLLFGTINFVMLKYSHKFFPKYLAMCPVLLLLSLTLFLFPGHNIFPDEKTKDLTDFKMWIYESSFLTKFIWGLSLLSCLVIIFLSIVYQNMIANWLDSLVTMGT